MSYLPPGPAQWTPPPPAPKKRWVAPVFIGVAVVVGLCCGGSVIAAALSDPQTPAVAQPAAPSQGAPDQGAPDQGAPAKEAPVQQAAASQAPAEAAAPGLKQPVRDGKFEFVVSKVECGAKTLGEAPFASEAQGEYCVVSLTVKNIGNEAQMFSGSNQIAYNAQDQKFTSDGGATLFLADTNSFLEDINPGNAVDGVVVFDVAPGTTLTRLELHDSFWSGGVEVGIG
jgi:hypothetical protein